MQIFILFTTILGAAYFLLFEPDSPIAISLMALAPLSWLGLFSVRFFSERNKLKEEGEQKLKKPEYYIDPDALVENAKIEQLKNKS